MTSLRPDDHCPECGCGYQKDDIASYAPNDDGWTGYCGHFDCGACSILRAEKDKLTKRYASLRELAEESKELEI